MMMSKDPSQAWLEGYLAALRDYAWKKDGVSYVGSGAKTYREAEEDALRLYGTSSPPVESTHEP